MRHQFQDTLKITVDHEHSLPPEEVDHVVDKVVEGAITILVAGTVAYILARRLT
jgi:hypothetical protein